MINKKAQGLTVDQIIFAVIAIAIIVIVGAGLYYVFNGNIKFLSWLPSFNKTVEPVKNIEILRYNIENEELSFYDGTQWIAFERGEVMLGEKRIVYESALEDFQDYFLQEREQKIILLDYRIADFLKIIVGNKGTRLSDTENSYILQKISQELNMKESDIKIDSIINSEDLSAKGNTIIGLKEKQSGKIISKIYLILHLDDSLEFNYPVPIDYTSQELLKEITLDYSKSSSLKMIFDEAKEWRDSIFKKQIRIKFNSEALNYCVQVKDNIYLIVNLAEPAGSEMC